MNFRVMKNMMLRIGFLSGFLLGISRACFAQSETDSVQLKSRAVIFINGKPVRDTLRLSEFERIDYIKGKQAIELVGPRGKGGVYLVSSDGKIPVYGIVTNPKGNKISGVEVISSEGKVVARTNKCGTFFISAVKLYDVLVIRKKRFENVPLRVQQTENVISLTKKRKQ
ncbi:MAG: hypothetical protein IM574_05780 [Cytophagales bacterium]|jgi:hypothetical protein|nr:hypothetical protein [Cytophagales bacterium]MCA6388724.1 hypothetical protein [Cytophagales bacterium]MCA6391955.1 hypothetical protein [Cytophagales bacterium]MCA6395996.1 hypothetical protein [Cytophagales bacterium]MCA6397448.1 hypothetical protein [Cytophagales bacterium]